MVGRNRPLSSPLLILFRALLLVLSFAYGNLRAGGETQLKIGNHLLTVELAESPMEQMTGLMNRKALDPDHGMLFIFPFPKQATFWMHNTSIPLDLVFLNTDGVILEILPLVPFEEKRVASKPRNQIKSPMPFDWEGCLPRLGSLP